MKAVNTKKSNAEEKNILFSLQYLSNEAMRMGYGQLYAILQAALKLAADKDFFAEDVNGKSILPGENPEDSQAIYEFLMLFAQAMPDTKNEIISVMELMEISESDLQDNYEA